MQKYPRDKFLHENIIHENGKIYKRYDFAHRHIKSFPMCDSINESEVSQKYSIEY